MPVARVISWASLQAEIIPPRCAIRDGGPEKIIILAILNINGCWNCSNVSGRLLQDPCQSVDNSDLVFKPFFPRPIYTVYSKIYGKTAAWVLTIFARFIISAAGAVLAHQFVPGTASFRGIAQRIANPQGGISKIVLKDDTRTSLRGSHAFFVDDYHMIYSTFRPAPGKVFTGYSIRISIGEG